MRIRHSCEFCGELGGASQNRFANLYRNEFSQRVLAKEEGFVALPTLGQLFTGSLLLLPEDHVDRCASLSVKSLQALASFKKRMSEFTDRFGHTIFFEHGSTIERGGSCGIYHAHLHLVPLPQHVDMHQLFPEYEVSSESLEEVCTRLKHEDHYLYLGDSSCVLSRSIRRDDTNFPSQFFRRRLVEFFGLGRPWDWRTYDHKESRLVSTMKAFTVTIA